MLSGLKACAAWTPHGSGTSVNFQDEGILYSCPAAGRFHDPVLDPLTARSRDPLDGGAHDPFFLEPIRVERTQAPKFTARGAEEIQLAGVFHPGQSTNIAKITVKLIGMRCLSQ